MTDHTNRALVPYTVIATTGLLVAYTLPGAAVLALSGVTVAAFVAAGTLARLLAVARPARAAAYAAAAVLVLLGGPVVAAATLGPPSVPLLACVAVLLALVACPVLVPRGTKPVQEPRNVDR